MPLRLRSATVGPASGGRSSFRKDLRGAAAVEFAMVMPMLMILYLGGFAISQAASTWRKLSDTTSQLANVAAQYTTMQSNDAQGVMAAAAQIMAPYSTSNLSEVLTLVGVSAGGSATVTWSQAYNGGTALSQGAAVSLPTNMLQPGMSVVWVQTTYSYNPVVGANYVPAITMHDQIYSAPRSSPSIPCSSC
jgi:Flp pilus assembly protein TadG